MDPYNILVVDDEESNLNALRRALRHEYKVFSANNGKDALAIMHQNDIALIIADHRMPGMTGIELLEKALQEYPNTIRVILTSYTGEELLMDAINTVHAHGFLSKPWEPEEVRSIVEKWIKTHKALESLEEKASYLREEMELKTHQLKNRDRQIGDLQRQLGELQKVAEETSHRHDTAITQLMQLKMELKQNQQLLKHYQFPWWKRLFRRGRTRD